MYTLSNPLMLERLSQGRNVFFGAGSFAENLLSVFPYPVAYLVDNSSAKWGKSLAGHSIFSIARLQEEVEDPQKPLNIVIASQFYDEISTQLLSIGFKEGDFIAGLFVLDHFSYQQWRALKRLRDKERDEEKESMQGISVSCRPVFTLYVNGERSGSPFFEECLQSVLRQSYPHWQLVLAGSGEDGNGLSPESLSADDRITLYRTGGDGSIVRCINETLTQVKGDYIGILNAGDVLDSDALMELVRFLDRKPFFDIIYSDEDRISRDGSLHYGHYFKPDWSPDTLMSRMYLGNLTLWRRSMILEVKGLEERWGSLAFYDLALRCAEKQYRFGHVHRVLYHVRDLPPDPDRPDPPPREEKIRLKEESLARLGRQAHVTWDREMAEARVIYQVNGNPLVTLLVLTHDNSDDVTRLIRSIFSRTTYPNYEVVVLNRESDAWHTEKLHAFGSQYPIRIVDTDIPFNYAAVYNFGMQFAGGQYVMMLNDDMEVLTPEWIERMLGHAQLPHIGAVGAKLLYPDSSKIQHCGVINTKIGPFHALGTLDDRICHYYGVNKLECNWLGITGACLLIEKKKYLELGGMDERLEVTFNDIDLCMRLYRRGYFHVVRSDVILYHYESKTRGLDRLDPAKMRRLIRERNLMYRNNPCFRSRDPFYSPHFGDGDPFYVCRREWGVQSKTMG